MLAFSGLFNINFIFLQIIILNFYYKLQVDLK